MAKGTIVSKEVEAAFRAVPRHLFTPGATLEESYANDTVRTKRDEHGITISAVSAPWLQAMMLEQGQLGLGMRVLEVGLGGYNAALMAELVGEDGAVTTVDIDPDVINRAHSCLIEAGYSRVNVVLADAEGGVPEHAPYDRIAPRGALLYPQCSWEELEGRFLGPMTYLDSQEKGDNSMSENQRSCSGV